VQRKTVICIALSLAAFAPIPALAQAVLPAYEVVTIIRSMGLDPLDRPMRRGPNYVLRAVDNYGEEVSVTVDALRGRVLSVRPVVPVAAPYGPRPPTYDPAPRYAAPPYYGPPRPYAPPSYYVPEAEFDSDATYEPMPSYEDGPRVIYAPRDDGAPRAPARAAAKPPAVKSTAVKPPPDPAPPEQTTGSVSSEKPPAETSSALTAPPVQTFE
jgi:hypothetical protein